MAWRRSTTLQEPAPWPGAGVPPFRSRLRGLAPEYHTSGAGSVAWRRSTALQEPDPWPGAGVYFRSRLRGLAPEYHTSGAGSVAWRRVTGKVAGFWPRSARRLIVNQPTPVVKRRRRCRRGATRDVSFGI